MRLLRKLIALIVFWDVADELQWEYPDAVA